MNRSRDRVGILLVNTGTPDEPTPMAVRRYLAQFLADPRVVDLPRWLWRPILHGIVLRVRPRRSADRYRRIWTATGSPLLTETLDLAEAVGRRLDREIPGTLVRAAMRYGSPPIPTALAALQAAGAARVVVLPLFPQTADATTGSVLVATRAAAAALDPPLPLTELGGYHDDPGYLDALAAAVRAGWARSGPPGHTVVSFHGIPCRHDRRDGYAAQCRQTAEALAERLGLTPDEWTLTFQSRFGPGAWLGPATRDVLAELGERQRAGLGSAGRIDLLTPGFAVDCLETVDELGTEAREHFENSGGTDLFLHPCLGSGSGHADALAHLLLPYVTEVTS